MNIKHPIKALYVHIAENGIKRAKFQFTCYLLIKEIYITKVAQHYFIKCSYME